MTQRFRRTLSMLTVISLCLAMSSQHVHADTHVKVLSIPAGLLGINAETLADYYSKAAKPKENQSPIEPGFEIGSETPDGGPQIEDIQTITLVKTPKDMTEADPSADPDAVFLVGNPSASMATLEAWAISKGMGQEGLDLIPIYYEICGEKGLDPVIQYVQMCIETGWLYNVKSQAGLDASYHNPCGLKTTAGGGNYDANAHMRFDSWYDGIDAHTDHTALYAGLPGYPRPDTKDPRHFNFLFGIGDTVSLMGMRWVGKTPETDDGVYAAKIMKLYNEVLEWD